jgi:hypothetical protein
MRTAPRNLRPLALALIVGLAGAAGCRGRLFSELEQDTDSVPLSEIVDVWRVGTRDPNADGADTVRFMVRLPGTASNRVVKLTTSAGVWVESVNHELAVRTTPDSGDARLIGTALLRAPKDSVVRLAVIRATVGDTYYDTVSVRFVPLPKP